MGDQLSDHTSTQPASDSPDTSSPPHHHFHIHLPHHPTTSPPPPCTHHIHLHIPHPFSKPSWTQPPFFRPSSSSTTQQQPPPPAQSSTHPLLHSTDPTTAPLRAFAEEKSNQHPGEDGSFGTGYTTTMSWGAGSWILPHEGDTKKPPDERRGIHYHYHLEGVEGDWVEGGKEEEKEKGEEKKD